VEKLLIKKQDTQDCPQKRRNKKLRENKKLAGALDFCGLNMLKSKKIGGIK